MKTRHNKKDKKAPKEPKNQNETIQRTYSILNIIVAVMITALCIILTTFAFGIWPWGGPKVLVNAWSTQCQTNPEEWLHPLEDPEVSAQAALLGDPRLLWGTYRPSVYFGFKSRTAPESVTGGLLWHGPGRRIEHARHDCQEGDRLDRYGWTRHDGVSFGEQEIIDSSQRLQLKTTMVKPDQFSRSENADSRAPSTLIAMRIEAVTTSRQTNGLAGLFWYFGVDFDGNVQPDNGSDFKLEVKEANPFALTLSVWTEKLGDMKLHIQVANKGQSGDLLPLSYWGARNMQFADVHQHLKAECDTQQGGICSLQNTVQANSNLICIVAYGAPQFIFDVMLSRPDSDGKAVGKEDLTDLLTKWIGHGSAKFDTDFEAVYKLHQNGFGGKDIQAAKVALSNMIGGLGYFHGQNLVRSRVDLTNGKGQREVHLPSFDSSLFTAVPSRSFFPRGFLWDEGFHQLLISQWDSGITMDVLRHWMNTIHIHKPENKEETSCTGGWIPREQILGEISRRRVPYEFIPQDIDVANPPTMMLVLRSLLEKLNVTCSSQSQCDESDAEAQEIQKFIAEVAPKVDLWVQWLLNSQRPASASRGSGLLVQWQGRDPSESKLIPNTLASGLDDYPRSIPPHPEEVHIDLLCWMILCCQLMAQIQELFPDSSRAMKLPYRKIEKEMTEALHEYHWNEEMGGFYDLGIYSKFGEIINDVVVRCMSKERRSKDIGVPIDLYDQLQQGLNPCPSDFPNFAYPLGDGQGGLLMRERYAASNPSFGHVLHNGYTTIFPLILKLLDPSSAKLERLLDIIHNEDILWSPYGIRSLSKDNVFYGKENAPGDAPYWRGYIWININYLTLDALNHYSKLDGPYKERCRLIYSELRRRIMDLILNQYHASGYFWEQYDDQAGRGLRSHPFTGWTALVLNIMAEIY